MTVKRIGTHFFNYIFDCVFPKQCVGCLSEGTVLCTSCRALLVYARQDVCIRCEKKSPFGLICSTCEEKTSLSLCIFLFSYSNPLVRRIVHECKYRYIEELGEIMGLFIIERIKSLGLISPTDQPIVIPIPLHRKRFLERGFNQAEHIARAYCLQSESFLRTDILFRALHRPPQALLTKKERLENTKGVFEVHHGDELKDKQVILIDDVCTSGATLFEAAAMLAPYHPKSIRAYTFAHG